MKILTKNRLHFVVDYKEFTTAGKGIVEEAPDWIARDPYFQMAQSAGVLTVISRGSKPKSTESTPVPTSTLPADIDLDTDAGEGGVSLSVDEEVSTDDGGKVRPNTTTARELIALAAKQVEVAVKTMSGLDVLQEARDLEAAKSNARKTVLKAIDVRLATLMAG
jgi:hypothetical protein